MIKLILQVVAVCFLLAGSVQAADLASIDADAMSGNLEGIRKSINDYESLHSDDADVLWKLIRAYYNYYDELTERDRSEQKWAANRGYEVAKTALPRFPHKAEVVYYSATIGLAYAEVHRFKAPLLLGDLFNALEEARDLDPAIDGGGPDRRLAFLYGLPWPLGKGDKEKTIEHMQNAMDFAPMRASNRLGLAKAFADLERYDEGWPHVQFMRTGKFWAASEHWKKIYLRRVEEVAAEFPQNLK